ncbi:MAG: hypothetical protein IT379_31215, partial [Deltaproteobacteria bacterium]|nr:hypothetical protein [Deltaproteobacteria bacterium]
PPASPVRASTPPALPIRESASPPASVRASTPPTLPILDGSPSAPTSSVELTDLLASAPRPNAPSAPAPPAPPPRRDPSEPDIEITVAEPPSSRSSSPSGRPVVDGALPSVIVAKELDPIVTNVPASKAARMGLVPGGAPSSSGGIFVLVLILVGLALIVLLGWSMAKRRTPEPTEPDRHGALDARPPAHWRRGEGADLGDRSSVRPI